MPGAIPAGMPIAMPVTERTLADVLKGFAKNFVSAPATIGRGLREAGQVGSELPLEGLKGTAGGDELISYINRLRKATKLPELSDDLAKQLRGRVSLEDGVGHDEALDLLLKNYTGGDLGPLSERLGTLAGGATTAAAPVAGGAALLSMLGEDDEKLASDTNATKRNTEMSYEQGFMDKCAEYGVDPDKLIKVAARGDYLAKLLNHPKAALHPITDDIASGLKNFWSKADLAPAVSRMEANRPLGLYGNSKLGVFGNTPREREVLNQIKLLKSRLKYSDAKGKVETAGEEVLGRLFG
jgi:hypothetical protein